MSCMIRIPEGHGIRYDKQGQHHFYPILTMEQLVANVQGWGKQVKILTNGQWLTQASKLIEEVGEGAGWLCRGNGGEVKDAVGDKCFLTVMVATMLGLDAGAIMDTVAESYYTPAERAQPLLAHRLLHKVNLHFALAIDTALESEVGNGPLDDYAEANFMSAISWLREYADINQFTLEDAFSMAWDIVKDRKGRLTPEGVFIKMSDAAYFAPAELLTSEQIDVKLEEVVKNGATVMWLGPVGDQTKDMSEEFLRNRMRVITTAEGFGLVTPQEELRETVYVFVPEDSAKLVIPMPEFIGMVNGFHALKSVKEYIVIKEHNA